jgi:hypothetical protein
VAFLPRLITKFLDFANLQKHNDNYTDIKTELDAHDAHIAATSGVHGATSAATASRIVTRDAAGRAKVAVPSAADDIARKDTVDAVGTALIGHATDSDVHTTPAEKLKLANIQSGAEVNQNAFAKITAPGQTDIDADGESATIKFKNGTGITVTTNQVTGEVTITATGEATPGAHGSSHDSDGSDPIPDLIALQEEVEDLAGVGRTTETIKENAVAITELSQTVVAHQADFTQLEEGVTAFEADYNTRVVKPTQQITPPSGLGFVLPFTVLFFKPYGYAVISYFDISSLAPAGKKYYVDVTIGLDTNDGLSANTPLKSIYVAVAKSDAVEVVVAAGVYPRINGFNGAAIARSISIKAEGGRAIISAHDALTWAVSSGYTHTYEAARSGVGNVFDTKIMDSDGDYTSLTLRASIALVDANPGSYYADGTKVYVRTRDSRVVDNAVRVYLTVNNVRATGNYTIYLENIDLEGGSSAARVENSAVGQTAKFYAKNCTFKYSTTGDAVRVIGADAIFQNCVAAQGFTDGFNYHAQNIYLPKAIEINCIGRNNGLRDGGGTHNGSTMHDGGTIVRINGKYFGNSGPNVPDVGASKSWNICCEGFVSALKTTSGVNFWSEGEMWLDGCISHGSTYDLAVDTSGTIHTRNLLTGGQNSIISGVIDTY